ncbi:MAG: secretin N-terminal domain-containing protein [Verrucomicrobiales bacterium]|nr:secretin N-terminal domain-containing protein [Verrucomicrobiales bacterium]
MINELNSKTRIHIFGLITFLFCGVFAQEGEDASLLVSFPNAPVAAILPYYEKLSGKKIVRGGDLGSTNISIVTESRLTREEALQFIDNALLLNGYAMLPVDEKTLKIINYEAGKSIRAQELPVITSEDAIPEGVGVINYVMHLNHASPDDAIRAFSDIVSLNTYGAMTALEKSNAVVITENASIIRMLLNLKQFVDVPPDNLIHDFVKLERADAERVAEIINTIVEQQELTGDTVANGVVQAIATSEGGNPEAVTNRGDKDTSGLSIVPYRRTNSILVVAPPSDFLFVENLIKSFDRPGENGHFLTRKLQFVSVLDYMSSFYNALSRGTDITQGEDLLEGGPIPSGGNGQSGREFASFDPGFSSSSSGFLGSGVTRDLLGTPDDVGTPVSYTIGNTLLIGDPQANSLVVSGSPENIAIIDRLIDEIDVQPRQVYLSTVIGQMTIGDDFDYSFNALQTLATYTSPSGNLLSGAASLFNGADPQQNVSGLNNSGSFQNAFKGLSLYGKFEWGGNGASVDSMLRLFARDTNFKILSRPSIYAQNNVKATISSGQRIAIPTSTLTSGLGFDNGIGGAITSNIEFRDVVLKLEVIPLINSDNQVTLKIAQVNDNVVGSQTISGNEIPTLSTQELITTVTVNGGETIVLGGLITERADETVTGIPGIRRIPLLGKMLGSTRKSSSREETLIFIQPHIIDGVNNRNPTDLERCRSTVLEETLDFAQPQLVPQATAKQICPEPEPRKKGLFNFRIHSKRKAAYPHP